jgi:hypothetical protein
MQSLKVCASLSSQICGVLGIKVSFKVQIFGLGVIFMSASM